MAMVAVLLEVNKMNLSLLNGDTRNASIKCQLMLQSMDVSPTVWNRLG